MGTQGAGSARDFCLDLVFAALAEVEKVCISCNNRWAHSLFRKGRQGKGTFSIPADQPNYWPLAQFAVSSLSPGFLRLPVGVSRTRDRVHVPVCPQAEHAGGLPAETLRLPFCRLRGPFLDQPDPGLAGRFS